MQPTRMRVPQSEKGEREMDEERTFYCEQAERNCPFDGRFRYCSCCELRLGVDDPKEKMVELLKLTPACICDLCGEEIRR